MRVLLDTNFLVYCAKQKIDYAEQIAEIMEKNYELAILDQCVLELKKIKNIARKYSDKQAAELALKIIKLNKIDIIKGEGKNADESLLKLSKSKTKDIIATVDLNLRKKLNKAIVIENLKHLVFR